MANLLGTTVNGALFASGRISVTYDTDRYQFNFLRASGSNWWVTNDSTTLGLHVNNVGDKFYFSTAGDFYSDTNGWLSTALAGKLSLSGGTMSGDIIFPNDSSAGLRNAAANAGFRLDDQYGNMYSYNLAGGYYVDATSYYFRSAAAANWMTISGGTVTATGDFRAPIFYDSQDTGYYLDPNSESKLRKLWINNGGAGAVGWSTGLNMGDGSNYWNLIQDAGVARQRNFGTGGYDWYNNTAGTQLMLLTNAGNLTVSADVRAPIFYDSQDTNYYVDPNGTSKLVQVNLGTVNTRLISDAGVGNLKIYGSASNYLGIGPYDNNGWVYFENIGNASGIYFNSPGRYAFDSVDVTPYTDNENSLGNGSYRWANIYTGGWLRNYGAQGMYNESYGTHFYSNAAEGFAITGSGGVVQLQFRSNHQSTSRGYVYADTSNNIGFLNDGGNWALRMSSTRNAEIFGSDLTIGAGGANSTNIIMGDNDEGSRVIHCNSNRIGFLTQAGAWGSYCNDDGSWVSLIASYAPIFYDSEDTAYYVDPNSTSRLLNVQTIGYVGFNGNQTRDKLRVWDSSTYTIGMKSGYDYGHLGTDEYAMSFQMNDNSGRGFWWGDEAHNDNQGAASLTTDGRMVIAKSLSIGEGEAVVSPSSTPLYVKGTTSGADVLGVDGINGRLFTVTDDLSGSLFSVNTIAGLPVIEAFADNTVTIGKYGYATTWSTTGFMTVPNSANIYRDLFINGGRGGNFGNRLIIGTDAATYTMNDSNLRPIAYLHGAYPVLTLNHTDTSNTSHGPTIQFTHHTNDKQWVIGSNGTGTRLDIGYSTNTNRNPHNGIDDYNGSTFIRVDNSGNVQLGRGAGRSTWVNDTLYVGASDSGDSHMYFGEDSSNWYGLHWYWDSGHIVYLYGRNAGTDTEIMRYTTNSNTYVEWRRNFHMNNYEINYVSQLHFNAGTRFVGNDTHYLNFKADAVDYGSIHVRDGNNTLRGYLGYFDSSGFGLLNSSGSWGIRFDPSNAGTDIFYAGGLKLRTLSGGARIYGDLFLDENYGYGIVGVYSAERYQGVFAMGNAYKLAADGQGTGSLYGLAWTHTNVGGESKSGLSHQLLVMHNGVTQTAIGSGIWTNGLITTTSYGTSSNWNTAYGWGNHASADYIVKGTQVLSAAGWSTATRFGSVGDISQSAGNHALSVRSEDGNDAFMSFHIGSDYAVHFGLDRVSNRMHVGGWSDGAVKYQLWDSRDFTSTNVSNWNTAYGWGNHASAGYQAASTAITTSNIGSQSVSNATTAGGLAVHSGRNNEVNKIVRTDGNGYIQAGWINSNSGNMGFETRIARIQCSDDNYIRFQTLTEFKVSMGLSGKNNYSRRIDYTADANYHVGSFGHAGTSTNDVWHYGSGFYDVWAGGGTFPGSMTHIHGFNAVHYSAGAGGNGYGWQMASQYNRPGEYYARNIDGGTFSSWRQFITSDNIGSQSVSYATTAGNAATATALQTGRTLTVGATGKTFDGTGNVSWTLGEIGAQAAGSYAAASHTHAISDVINLASSLNSKLGTSDKAADSELIDGIDSSRIIYGDGARGSALVSSMDDPNQKSGFFYQNNPPGQPFGDWWNWLTVAGNSWQSSNNYSFQISHAFHSDDAYIRRMTNGAAYGWRTLITSGNIGSQSVNYATSAGSATSSTTATTANRLERYGVIYGNNWNDYYLNNRFIAASAHNATGTNKPDGAYNYGSTLSYYNSGEDHYQIYVTENSVNSNGKDRKMYYRSGWNGSWGGWRSVVDVYNSVCYIDAAVTATGDITAFSDGRVKENVETLEGALDKTLKLRGVSYNRTDIEDKSTKIGVIAQEILEVVPEVVSQDENGMYAVSYGNITALLIEAIKEQQKQIDELKEIINGLTK